MKDSEGREGGLINLLPLKRRGLFERKGLIEDLRSLPHDALTGSSRNHSSRGVGTRDEHLRTFAWEARIYGDTVVKSDRSIYFRINYARKAGWKREALSR